MTKGKAIAISLIAVVGAIVVYVSANYNFAYAYAKTIELANRTGISNKVMCVYLPKPHIAFDSIDADLVKSWNHSLAYIVNAHNLSITASQSRNALRQRFVPSEQGSERVIGAFTVDSRTTYELKQSIFIEKGFDWGGEIESGKFGFGLGGGSAPSGGKTDKDGFTVRLAWVGDSDGTVTANFYTYSVDRTQNLPYGDLHTIPNFTVPVGEWFDVAMRVTVNSEVDVADGSLSVIIDGEPMFERKNIHWQSEGEKPTIDRVIYSTFHGGNTSEWTPDETVFAQFSNICLYD